MKKENESTASIILSAASILVTVILFRGFSLSYIAVIPLAVAAGFSAGTVLLPVLLVLITIGFISPEMIPWAAIAGGMISSTAGTGRVVRTAGFLSVAVCMWFVPLEASTIPVTVSAAGAFFSRRKPVGYAILAGGVLLAAFLTGLPSNPGQSPAVAASHSENGKIRYTIPALNGAVPEILIPAPLSGEWAMWLAYEGGGVRDTMPLAAVTLREEIVILPANPESLCFSFSPGDTLRISLLRENSPFSHPVIHVSAGGELI